MKITPKMKITANMATFPPRFESSLQVIDSLYDQVDVIRIYLNEYDEIPKEYLRDKVHVHQGDKNLKSSGKLFWATNPKEYYFCVDDDILYPSNYVEHTLSKLKKYNEDVIVSYHGRKFSENIPVDDYFTGYEKYYHFKQEVVGDHEVEVIGNGVSCWNTNRIQINWKDFPLLYMDDIFVSLQANSMRKKRIVLEHDKGFLSPIATKNTSLYEQYKDNNNEQTRIFNSVNWWK